MEEILTAGVMIAGSIATAFAFQQLFLHASLQMHKMQKMDESATETEATETVKKT
jgi:hypothetical protein